MGTTAGVFLLLGLVLAWYIVQRVISRAGSVAEGAFTGNTRTRGLAAVHRGLHFDLPVDGHRLVDRVLETLEVGTSTWNDGMRVDHLSVGHETLVLVVGNRFSESAKLLITTEANDNGSQGKACVTSWKEVEGRMPATDKIERFHKHVRSAVERLGGTVSEYEST